jgi:uncharacterized protein YqgV (UPF0045/DUF77 family)
MDAIKACHEAVHAMGTPRIAVSIRPETWRTVHIPSSRLMLSDCQTDIRIGTRIDKQINQGGNAGKVSRVEDILAKDTK